ELGSVACAKEILDSEEQSASGTQSLFSVSGHPVQTFSTQVKLSVWHSRIFGGDEEVCSSTQQEEKGKERKWNIL
ncbi:hypothetical protein E2320_019637, partial [Naja naja]